MSSATPYLATLNSTELSYTILSYAELHWATVHPILGYATPCPSCAAPLLSSDTSYWANLLPYWARLHPAEPGCILLIYAAPCWATLHSDWATSLYHNWATLHPNKLHAPLLSYAAPCWVKLQPNNTTAIKRWASSFTGSTPFPLQSTSSISLYLRGRREWMVTKVYYIIFLFVILFLGQSIFGHYYFIIFVLPEGCRSR